MRPLRAVVSAADDLRDAATADSLTRRLHLHEKAIWVLRGVVTG